MSEEELTAKNLVLSLKTLADKAPYSIGVQVDKEVGPVFCLEHVYNGAIDLLFPKVKENASNSLAFLIENDLDEALRTHNSIQMQDTVKVMLSRYKEHPEIVKALKIVGLAFGKRKKIVETIRRSHTIGEIGAMCSHLRKQIKLPTHANALSRLKNVTPPRLEK